MHQDSYIRGAAPNRIEPRRLGWGLALATVAALGLSAVLLAIMTASGHSSSAALRQRGVPVRATVTRCTGITSGIGMGAEYYQCRGSYTLTGRTFDEVIRGSRADLGVGAAVAALAVPGDPVSLSLPVVATSASTADYAASIVLGGLAVAGGVALLVGRRSWRPGVRRGPVRESD